MLICRRSTCVADATNHESIKFSVQQSHDCERPACTITLKLLINLIIYTCAFPLLRNSRSQIGTSFFFLIQTFAYLLHSGSQTAAPRHTCRSWSGRGAGLRSGTCCETRRWSSCTGAAPCLDSPRGAKGWRCHTLDCAWNLWNLKENTNVQDTNHLESKQVFVRGFCFLLSLCFCRSRCWMGADIICFQPC